MEKSEKKLVFQKQNGKEIRKLYLRRDIVLLISVFENFIKLSNNEFDFNLFYTLCLPGFTMQCGLETTGVNLQKLQDKEIILFLENILR